MYKSKDTEVREITGWKLAENEVKKNRDHLDELVKERTAGLQREIDERKQAEEALQKNYSTLLSIINSTNALVFSVDRKYCYTSFNKGHAAIMKAIYGADIEIGLNLLECMTVIEDRETARRNFDRALAGEQFIEEEYSGEELRSRQYFQVSHNPIKTETGEVIGVAVIAQDMTERKRALEALERSEKRNRSLVIATAQIVWTTNAMGMAVDIPEWRAFTGQSELEIKGWGWSDALHPDDRGRTMAIWKHAIETRSPYDTEYRVRRHDGEYRYFAVRGVPILEKDGNILEWVGTCTDITERKEAEEILRESEEKYRLLIASMAEGVTLQDQSSTILAFNKSAERILGLTSDQLLGRTSLDPCWRSIHEDGSPFPGEMHPVMMALRTGLPQSDVIMGIHKPDGTLTWISINVQPIFQEGETKPYRVVATMHDITESKQAEEKLREVSLYTRSLIEASLDPLVTISKDGKITDVNKATEIVTGVSREQLIESDFSEYFTEPEKAREGYEQVFEKGFVTDYPLAIRHTSGKITDVLYNASVYKNEAGEVLGVFAAARDITEKKMAEEALRKREAELNESQRLAHIGSWDWNAVTDTIWWSAEYYRIYGYDPEMPTPNYVEHLKAYTSESTERLDTAVKKALGTGEPYELDLELAEPTASTRWIVARGEAKRDADGRIWGLRGTAQNITERKIAEQKLRNSEEKYRRIVETANEGIWLIDKDNRTSFANDRMADMLGYNKEEMIGKSLFDFMDEQGKNFAEKAVERRKLGIREEHDSRFLRKDGKYIWASLRTSAVFDENNNYVGALAMVTDITGRKTAEEAVAKSEMKYRMLFEDAGDYILIISFADADRPVIIDANNAAFRYHGYGRDELIGKAIWELDAPGYFEKNIDIVRLQIQKPGDSCIFESVHIRKDGSIFPVEVSARLLQINDEPPFILTIERDITERKQAEKIRLENARLEAADKAKSEFLASMSHELRTPLNAIIGFSDIMKMDIGGKLNEEHKRFVENISSSGKFLLSLINDILDLSKVEAGKIELEIAKISVPATINETLTLMREKAMRHNVSFKTEIDPDLGFIEADKQRVKQILFNLLSNAIKFSKEEGGKVTIKVKKEGDMARISVSDTGIGIKEKNIGKLFQKFEQLEPDTSKKYGGTGLGLAITRQLVELHGGRIWAESRYGEGSTFTFMLPVQAKKENGNK